MENFVVTELALQLT